MGAEAAQPIGGRAYDGVLRREVPVSIRVIDEAQRSVEVIASTEALDAHGDIVKQFWDLSRYNKNGPVLWNHNIHESSPYSFGGAVRPEDTMPVGKGSDVRVESKQLVATLTLVKGSEAEEPFVAKLWRRIQQGVIKAVSVGFKPGQINRVLNAAGSTDHFELGSAERPNELREISFVPMGSNPEAVAKSIAWERKHLEAESTAAIAADNEGSQPMAMTAEEQKALDEARSAKTAAETRLADEQTKSKKLEGELTAEKATSTKLEKDLGTATKSLELANAALAKSALDALQGVKFAPAEREELDKLVSDIGLDRTKSLLEKRPDIALTQGVTVEGKELSDKSKGAPPPVDTSASPDAGSDDFLKSVNEGASKAVA